jgi:hypothetical protein
LKSNQSPEWAEKLRKHFMEVGAHLDVMFNKYDINIIIAPIGIIAIPTQLLIVFIKDIQ